MEKMSRSTMKDQQSLGARLLLLAATCAKRRIEEAEAEGQVAKPAAEFANADHAPT